MKAAGYEFGAGITARIRQVRFGIDGSFIGGDQAGTLSSGLNLHLYTFTDRIQTRAVVFSPQLGITVQLFAIDLTKPSAATDFNEALTTDPNRTQLNYYNTFLDVGLAIKLRDVGHRRATFPVFHCGYRYGLDDAPWRIRGGDVPDAPRDRCGNFYMAIAVGHLW
ncbi:MAG TPA: hypothetical protein VHE54_16455 [Puia sp.]|nr:hypothetical protein [Puia sp.]